MSIINASFFTGKRDLPNIGDTVSDFVGGNSTLQNYIDIYEREALIFALGRQEYENFVAQLEPDGTLKPGAPMHYDWLLNGYNYTLGGKRMYWNGLIYEVGSFKDSLLADYIYSRFLEHNQSFIGDVGATTSKSANGMRVSADQKITDSYNDFVKQYGGCISIGLVRHYHLFTDNNNAEATLYKFLQDQKEFFPDLDFTHLHYKNSFGI